MSRTDSADHRAAIYAALNRRNRIVAILRIWLPAIGIIIGSGLLLQFVLGSITPNFGFANVTIDRENLVVEAPNYTGIGAGGATYSVTAGSARAAIGNTDLVHLTDATFEMVQPSGQSFSASAGAAQVEVADQIVTVEGVTTVRGSNGLDGTIVDARIDLVAEELVARGPADLSFSSGTRVQSESMTYDSSSGYWSFRRATVTIPTTPGSAEERETRGTSR